ncbi:MAG: sulfite exporter TauE/SafE family protein [Nitrospira sp.]|nr:sulfite exporter TauE/SafE family protein [Nitrospira sp.]
MSSGSVLLLVGIGLATGLVSGLFGIGGGLLLIPALIYLVGFTQHAATGTSLAVLLLPVGLGAVLEYYRHGFVDLKVALVIALAVLVGGWFGAVLANQMAGPYLQLAFACFVVCVGFYLLYGALRQLSWI